MLWRFHLDGADTGDRFVALADAWTAADDPRRWYVFNDVHATMANVGAGRIAEAEHLVTRLAAYIGADGNGTGAGTNVAMTAEIGLPICRALVAYGQERWSRVIEELAPIRRRLQLFGGSHAQRDAWQRTLLEAALRGGELDLARALIAERLAVRPTSAYAGAQAKRILSLAS